MDRISLDELKVTEEETVEVLAKDNKTGEGDNLLVETMDKEIVGVEEPDANVLTEVIVISGKVKGNERIDSKAGSTQGDPMVDEEFMLPSNVTAEVKTDAEPKQLISMETDEAKPATQDNPANKEEAKSPQSPEPEEEEESENDGPLYMIRLYSDSTDTPKENTSLMETVHKFEEDGAYANLEISSKTVDAFANTNLSRDEVDFSKLYEEFKNTSGHSVPDNDYEKSLQEELQKSPTLSAQELLSEFSAWHNNYLRTCQDEVAGDEYSGFIPTLEIYNTDMVRTFLADLLGTADDETTTDETVDMDKIIPLEIFEKIKQARIIRLERTIKAQRMAQQLVILSDTFLGQMLSEDQDDVPQPAASEDFVDSAMYSLSLPIKIKKPSKVNTDASVQTDPACFEPEVEDFTPEEESVVNTLKDIGATFYERYELSAVKEDAEGESSDKNEQTSDNGKQDSQ